MEIHDYLRVFRRSIGLISLCVVAFYALGVFAMVRAEPEYRSQTQLLVSGEAGENAGDTYTSNQNVLQKMPSYTTIMGGTRVMQEVVRERSLPLAPQDLARQVTVENPPETTLITATLAASSAQDATALLTSVVRQFIALVDTFEPASGTAVRVSVLLAPTAGEESGGFPPWFYVPLGVLTGLAVGLGAALVRHGLDTSFHSGEQLGDTLKVPVLGTVAHFRQGGRHPIVVRSSPGSQGADDYRRVRTALQQRWGHGTHRIVVTASVPGEGASTTARNIAAALAEGGLRVVLVEADLRHPTLARQLKMRGHETLTSVLGAAGELTTAPWASKDEQLVVLPAPEIPVAGAGELVGSPAMRDLLDELDRVADVVVIDAPPMASSADAGMLAAVSSGVVLVVRAGRTPRATVRATLATFRSLNVPVLGAVVNNTRPATRRPGQRARTARATTARTSTPPGLVRAFDQGDAGI